MVTLDDPNPSDSPEMVMNYYSNFYPELTTATVHGPVLKDDKARRLFDDQLRRHSERDAKRRKMDSDFARVSDLLQF